MNRSGAILLVVSALTAIGCALMLALVVRVRSDAEESALVRGDAQARIMLVAACHYVQETSRLGWDDPDTPQHEECAGWIDARDGTPGPKTLGELVAGPFNDHPDDRDGNRVYRRGSARWPDVGGVARCPMAVWQRTRWAVLPAIRNPIVADPAHPDFGIAYLANPDPVPLADDHAAFAAGDARTRPGTDGRAWFRVLRIAPARFLVTSGAGASAGFRDWNEVEDAGATEVFADRGAFTRIRDAETRHWWLIEWSASSGDSYMVTRGMRQQDNYCWHPYNASHEDLGQTMYRNPVGSIRWIQHLDREPAAW